MMDGYYDLAEHYYQKAIKTSPSYYLKAHENIDRLERQRKRGTLPQQVRVPSKSAPTKPVETQASSQDITIAVNEAGEPVVTVAPIPSNVAVDIAAIVSGNNSIVIADKLPEAEINFTQPKIAETAALSVKSNESEKALDSASSGNEDSLAKTSASNNETQQKSNSYSKQGEQAEYRKALAMVRDGQFEDAAKSFNTFLDT
ncbi:MAG: hypothetical protein DRJ50_04740, partial [Actinobacteria bacterium]